MYLNRKLLKCNSIKIRHRPNLSFWCLKFLGGFFFPLHIFTDSEIAFYQEHHSCSKWLLFVKYSSRLSDCDHWAFCCVQMSFGWSWVWRSEGSSASRSSFHPSKLSSTRSLTARWREITTPLPHRRRASAPTAIVSMMPVVTGSRRNTGREAPTSCSRIRTDFHTTLWI